MRYPPVYTPVKQKFDSSTWDSKYFTELCTELLRLERDFKLGSNELIGLVLSFDGMSFLGNLDAKINKRIRERFHRGLLKELKEIGKSEEWIDSMYVFSRTCTNFNETLDKIDETGKLPYILADEYGKKCPPNFRHRYLSQGDEEEIRDQVEIAKGKGGRHVRYTPFRERAEGREPRESIAKRVPSRPYLGSTEGSTNNWDNIVDAVTD